MPSTWDQVRAFLVPEVCDGTGLVYVAGANGLVVDAALAGGLSARYFEHIGFEGMVLGGAVRDMDELRHLKIPIVASGFHPVDTQGSYRIGSTGTQCSIDGVIVRTGDIIFSDDTGVVVIPNEIEEEVIDRAWCIAKCEIEIAQRIDKGERLHDLVDELRQI
jgi:regulator of RNase E activity RraA